MKISQAIKMLSLYNNQDQEIYIEWWDKETAEDNAEQDITDDEWEEVVMYLEDYEPYHGTSSYMTDKILEIKEKQHV